MNAVRDHLLLYLNGKPLHVCGDDAFFTLSDFLRRRQNLIGTKVVCAEGDCGSCTVMLGRVDGEKLTYGAITSCIQSMFQLDGMHIVTVEGLTSDGGQLNAIQQSMVKCQATQCGFCTPGFIVSLYDLMRDKKPCDTETVRRGLIGNLCRCTGYDSILRAAMETDRAAISPIDRLYPSEKILPALLQATKEPVLIDTGQHRFFKPVTLEAATKFRKQNEGCLIISGGTDLGVVINKRLRELSVAMSTAGLASLRGVKVEADGLYLGASATLSELESIALSHLPELGKFLGWFGSPLIRNAGTIAGNLVTGSPIGDTIPALSVLGAEIDLAGINGTRRVHISQFYTGYRQTVLAADELVVGVRIPFPKSNEIFKLYKVSRRLDLDISTFSAAICMQRCGTSIEDIRIAYGGVGPMVMQMSKTESLLRGGEATLEQFERAGAEARQEVTPISDVRGSAEYRRQLAANILIKFWHEAVKGT
ncbi:MAG TPA: FAD binding domain-containing protein [Tepidisphaeraceae bacterium]|nr:FAD binding domain-containing protein [Tepidisphaeraceae bacterium]